MPIKARTMRTLRQVHLYVGLFFAPLILLFSFSGALQTFGLHEARAPSDQKPPAWIVWMASVHKHQSLPRPARAGSEHKPDNAGPHAPPIRRSPEAPTQSTLPLKIVVAAMALGLIVSTLIGVTIALNNPATRRLSILLLAAGGALPLALSLS